MPDRHSLPLIWLLSDARNDARLGDALARMPARSGFVFRHYHLPEPERRERFAALSRLAKAHGHTVLLSSSDPDLAREWGADGIYAASGKGRPGGLWLASAHDGDEIQEAVDRGANGIFLSPVFPTRSHENAATLGAQGFQVLAQQSPVPVIALGGMNVQRARELDWPRWGAIDGLP